MPSTSQHRTSAIRRIAPEILERWGLILVLLALILWFSLDSTTGDIFRSSANIENILGNQGVTGLIALAMVVPLVSGYFDLSVAAVAGLSNVTMAALVGTHQEPIIIGILGTLLVAGIAGCVNGILVAGLKLNGFVITLGTYTLIGGLLQWYSKGQTISSGIPVSLGDWGSAKYLGLPRPFWVLIAVALVVWYVLEQTPFGRKLEGIGSNEDAARLVGIRVDRAVFLSFLGSALLAGVAGILLTITAGNANPTAGPSYLFPALAAVFLGATVIRPGRYNVWGTIVGVYLVAVAVTGFTLLGASSWVTPVFNGAALVGAVMVSTLMGRQRQASERGRSLDDTPHDPGVDIIADSAMDGASDRIPSTLPEDRRSR